MKHLILHKILRYLKSTPNLRRKLIIFFTFGSIAVVALTGLMIWAGLTAVSYTSNQIQALHQQGHFENLETQLGSLPQVNTVSCWSKAQTLMSLNSWLTTSITDNFAKLKVACLENKNSACEAPPCAKKDSTNTANESEQWI